MDSLLLTVAHRFSQILRRQTSLNHLCQASRSVLQNSDVTTQMLEDWYHIDLSSICKQTLYTMDNYNEKDHQNIITCKMLLTPLKRDDLPSFVFAK